MVEPSVAQSALLPSCSSWFICTHMWDHVLCQLPPATSPTPQSSSCRFAMSPLCPCCLSPPLLLVRMNVSSLTPWLLDFHTVWFSGSSGYILLLNLLLSFFWLYKEVMCVYLCLNLGQKIPSVSFNYLISIRLVYKLRQYKIQKPHKFWRMAGFCLRVHPLQSTQRRIIPPPSTRPSWS